MVVPYSEGAVVSMLGANLPLTHEHIISTILLYSDSQTLNNCEEVCSTWSSWISSSMIWSNMLTVVGERAKSLAWSIRYDTSAVGAGWMNDEGCDFVIHRLEQLAVAAKEMVKHEQDKVREKALQISSFLSDTNILIGTELYPVQMYEVLKRQEVGVSKKCPPPIVSWLQGVGEVCSFTTETIHQAVSIIDRELARQGDKYNTVQKQKVLATVALTIAAEFEYEEGVTTLYGLYSDTTDDEYTEKEIFSMADTLRATLQHDWYRPSSHLFLSKLVNQISPVNNETSHLAHYYNHLLLLHGEGVPGVDVVPSLLSSACLSASMQVLGQESWSSYLQYITGYTYSDIQDIVQFILDIDNNTENFD